MGWGGSRTDPKGGQINGPRQRWTTLTSMSLRPPHPLYSCERSPLILWRTAGHFDDCHGVGSRITGKMATARYVARSGIRSLTLQVERPVGRSVARSSGRAGGRVFGRSLGREFHRSVDRSLPRSFVVAVARSVAPSFPRSVARIVVRYAPRMARLLAS